MGQLLLVRHAQASYYGARYDQLSGLGHDQARRLGTLWAAQELKIGRVFVGPRLRHAQTCAEVARSYAERGLPFPEPTPLAGLDEHQGVAVAKAHLGRGDPAADTMPGGGGPPGSGADQASAMRELLEVLRHWARGQVSVDGYESWEDFRARVLLSLDLMCETPAGGHTVAFTSGGFVCAAAGWILGLDSDRVIDLHTVIRNASVTEVGYTGRRRRLVDFNGVPHLQAPGLATLI